MNPSNFSNQYYSYYCSSVQRESYIIQPRFLSHISKSHEIGMSIGFLQYVMDIYMGILHYVSHLYFLAP